MEVATIISLGRARATAPPTARWWRRSVKRVVVTLALACLVPAASSLAEDAPATPKVLRVATSGDYAPFSFAAPSSPQAPAAELEGFDIEVARQFAQAHGYTVEFVRFRWPDLSRELAAGGFDVAMSGVTMRPERSISGRFSVPVAATHAVALTWKGSGAATFQDLDKPSRRIAVNAGGHLEKVAREVFRRADIIPLNDNDAVRMAMLDRTYDAVVTDNYEAKVWTASALDVVSISPLSDDRKAYLLPAARVELAGQLDRWLLAREKDGTLEKLRVHSFSGGAAPTGSADEAPAQTAMPLAALTAAVVERLALMPMVYEAKRLAGKPIEDKDQETAILDGAQRAVAAEATMQPAGATAATVAPPDPQAVRALFEALIVIGKDAQQKLADRDAKRRPAGVQDRSAAQPKGDGAVASAPAPAVSPTGDSHAVDAATSLPGSPPDSPSTVASDAAATGTAPATYSTPRQRVYDLATELRPAIGRISAKIASILVAMDEPISQADARRTLGNALTPHEVSSQQVDAMAAAIARISSRR